MSRRLVLLSASLLACAGAATAAVASDSSATPEAAVSRYVAAEHAFDVATLRAVLLPRFVEVSPRGEVDEHDAVLGFYAPEKKTTAPPVALRDVVSRVNGDTAFVTASVVFTVKDAEHRLTLGASVVKGADGWRLASAQYTGVPPRSPSAPQQPSAPTPPAAPMAPRPQA
ncbi:nuclear transport factor 2 family protein [Luteibacter sp. 9135]|uniref:nuclear transport factor 2 family protein n=1 Tax=Luteibacter sp. 9135 TaxID=1500893 RepID=UPI00068BEC70|nr:nuclear transport factor 2 family protein [Luteibacter sp. 9135]